MRINFGFIIIVATFLIYDSLAFAGESVTFPRLGIYAGMPKDAFFVIHPKKTARTYRQEGLDEWLTFNVSTEEEPGTVTFHLRDDKIQGWRLNDRVEVVREYLGEFCSQGIIQGMPGIHTAIQDVLERLPLKDFLNVTDRRRPVLFTEYYDSGTARFANTSEIIALADDAPAWEAGLTIIKLSSALNEADTPEPVKGVVAHELAHRVLDHSRKGPVTCKEEREANTLVGQWGFKEEFQQASKMFGRKEGEPSSCKE